MSYTFPSCAYADFPASDANPVRSPLAKYCAPCVPSGTGGTLLSQPPKPPVRPQEAPLWQNKPWLVPGETLWYEVPVFSFRKSTGFLRPVRACVGSFRPRWGNAPPPPGQGPVWATQGRVWQKEKKTAHPPGWGKIWGCEKTAAGYEFVKRKRRKRRINLRIKIRSKYQESREE